jgi:hypothetical protein
MRWFGGILISTVLTTMLVGLAGSVGYAGTEFDSGYVWPLKLPKQFSSGFGDSRSGRFHKGVDLRTGGKEGAMVYAPEKGYVWMIKTSYRGYGKALYIKGNSGRIYAFFHLSRYNKDVGSYLRKRQIESKRYYQDITLDEKQFPVKAGAYLARTGQTGAGAPHLHFEVRDSQGRPTNPLYYPVDYADVSPPGIKAIWLYYCDDHSLFEDGSRESRLIPVRAKNTGNYSIRDTIVVTGRFGVKAAVDDIVGPGSFDIDPSRIRLTIDGQVYHEVEYSRLDFAEDRYSVLDRDFDPQKKRFGPVFNLYRGVGNKLSIYRSAVAGDGTFSDTVSGYHAAVIETWDAHGNTSRLDWVFYYHPAGEILQPFEYAETSGSQIVLKFASEKSRGFFDSAAVTTLLPTANKASVKSNPVPVLEVNNDGLILRGDFNRTADYRLRFFKAGHPFFSYFFSMPGVAAAQGKAVASSTIDSYDDALLITAKAADKSMDWLAAEFVTDRGVERRSYHKSAPDQFSLYYQPQGDVETVSSMINVGPAGYLPDTVSLQVRRIKAQEPTQFREGRCVVEFRPGDLFSDALLYLRDTVLPAPKTAWFAAAPIVLGPIGYSFADGVNITFEIALSNSDPKKWGLYGHNGGDDWNWAGGKYDSAAQAFRGNVGSGVWAVIADTTAPVISELNMGEGEVIKSSQPEIRFRVKDDLSDIEDDRNFDVTIDGKWMVPEYDPESGGFSATPHWTLTGGEHKLRIQISDRCGNQKVLTRKFLIRAVIGP